METAGMTRLVMVFMRITSSTNSAIKLIVEDHQTNRLTLDLLSRFAQIGQIFDGYLLQAVTSTQVTGSAL
jgi:hypothetical protein